MRTRDKYGFVFGILNRMFTSFLATVLQTERLKPVGVKKADEPVKTEEKADKTVDKK